MVRSVAGFVTRRVDLGLLAWLAVTAGCSQRLELGREQPPPVVLVDEMEDEPPPVVVMPPVKLDAGTSIDTALTDAGEAPCPVGMELRQVKVPVDLIFLIDNSSSNTSQQSFQDRVNDELADILAIGGIDFRVIVISRYGKVGEAVGDSDNPICIGAPLSTSDCSDPENTPLMNNPPRFFHYSADIRSLDGWCKLLEGFNTPDELPSGERDWTPLAPEGWSGYLRADAFKSFVIITDDTARCSYGDLTFGAEDSTPELDAATFDSALLGLSQEQFGTALDRRYDWHSVAGMIPNSPELAPWLPAAPIQSEACSDADSAGTPYQALSRLTGGLRFSSCLPDDLGAFFYAFIGGVETTSRCQ